MKKIHTEEQALAIPRRECVTLETPLRCVSVPSHRSLGFFPEEPPMLFEPPFFSRPDYVALSLIGNAALVIQPTQCCHVITKQIPALVSGEKNVVILTNEKDANDYSKAYFILEANVIWIPRQGMLFHKQNITVQDDIVARIMMKALPEDGIYRLDHAAVDKDAQIAKERFNKIIKTSEGIEQFDGYLTEYCQSLKTVCFTGYPEDQQRNRNDLEKMCDCLDTFHAFRVDPKTFISWKSDSQQERHGLATIKNKSFRLWSGIGRRVAISIASKSQSICLEKTIVGTIFLGLTFGTTFKKGYPICLLWEVISSYYLKNIQNIRADVFIDFFRGVQRDSIFNTVERPLLLQSKEVKTINICIYDINKEGRTVIKEEITINNNDEGFSKLPYITDEKNYKFARKAFARIFMSQAISKPTFFKLPTCPGVDDSSATQPKKTERDIEQKDNIKRMASN